MSEQGCITVFKSKLRDLIEQLKHISGTEDVVKELEKWLI